MATKNYTIQYEDNTVTAKTKINLVIELAKKGLDIDLAEAMVKEEFMTDKQRVAITKKANVASIKTVAQKLTLARKLNATLNARNSKAWETAREVYTTQSGVDTANMSNKAIEKAIKALIADVVVLEGFEA